MGKETRAKLLELLEHEHAEISRILSWAYDVHFVCDGCDLPFIGHASAYIDVDFGGLPFDCVLCADCVKETGKSKRIQRRFIQLGMGLPR